MSSNLYVTLALRDKSSVRVDQVAYYADDGTIVADLGSKDGNAVSVHADKDTWLAIAELALSVAKGFNKESTISVYDEEENLSEG